MATLKEKIKDFNDKTVGLSASSSKLAEVVNKNTEDRSRINLLAEDLLRDIVEIEKLLQWMQTIFYQLVDPKAIVPNNGGTATFSDKYHALGGRVQGAMNIVSFIKVEAEENPIDKDSILSSLNRFGKALKEIEDQMNGLGEIVAKSVNPDKDLYYIEEQIKKENNAFLILLVEDDPDILHFTDQILKKKGFRVDPASDVERGIKILKEKTVDILVLDLALPSDMEGLKVLSFVRENKLKTKCIVQTKYDGAYQLGPLKALQPEKILIKGEAPERLIAQINALAKEIRGR